MRRSGRGFTLIEVMVTVGILGILTGLSVTYLSAVTPRARLSGSLRELNSNVAASKGHAYARGVRVGLLVNTAATVGGEQRVRYWLVSDPWSTLDEAMATNAAWQTPGELVPQAPAPSGAAFPSLDSGGTTMERNVGLPADFLVGEVARTGFRGEVPRAAFDGPTAGANPGTNSATASANTGVAAYAPCTKAGDVFRLQDGSAGGSNFFPPPYCMVPVGGCTFCSAGRGAIFFEPDGQVRLVNAAGSANPMGAGSLSLGASGVQDVLSMVFTSSGLVRAF